MEKACVHHPESPAIAGCKSCGTSLCLMCATEVGGEIFCSAKCADIYAEVKAWVEPKAKPEEWNPLADSSVPLPQDESMLDLGRMNVKPAAQPDPDPDDCPRHPGVAAPETCSRCGKRACPTCLIKTQWGNFCSVECSISPQATAPGAAPSGKAVPVLLGVAAAAVVLVAVLIIAFPQKSPPAPAVAKIPSAPAQPAKPEPAKPVVAKPETAKPVVAKPEPAKPEPAKPEPAKPEPAKPVVVKPEPAKPEPAKPEPAKPVVAKPEPAKPEPAKPEPAKPVVAKPEPAKPEPAKPEPPKPEPAKPVVAKPEPPKPEPPKPEPAKPEPAKPVEVKPEPAKPVVAKPEPAKPEPAKPEPAKPVVAKPEPAKPEPAKPVVAKPEPVKPEPAKPVVVKPEPAKPEPAKPPVIKPEPPKPEPPKPVVAKPEPPKPEPAKPVPPPDPQAKARKAMEEASRLIREATPLFRDVADAMDAPPSELAQIQALLEKSAGAQKMLNEARTLYASARLDAADAALLDRRIAQIDELLETLRSSADQLRGKSR